MLFAGIGQVYSNEVFIKRLNHIDIYGEYKDFLDEKPEEGDVIEAIFDNPAHFNVGLWCQQEYKVGRETITKLGFKQSNVETKLLPEKDPILWRKIS